MSSDQHFDHATTTTDQPAQVDPGNVARYQPPRLIMLGTLEQLTHGGNVSSQSDGAGFAGGSGVI